MIEFGLPAGTQPKRMRHDDDMQSPAPAAPSRRPDGRSHLADQDEPLSAFERQVLANYPWLVVVALVVLSPANLGSRWDDPLEWDWLFASGILLFFVAYPLTLRLPCHAAGAMLSLERVVPPASGAGLRTLALKLHEDTRRWANLWGAVVAAITIIAWLVDFSAYDLHWAEFLVLPAFLSGVLLETALAAGVGRFFGRVLCYATLARRLRRAGIPLVVTADRPDGLAALHRIGRLYVEAALLFGLLAIFLDVWLVLLPLMSAAYRGWRGPYAGLLVFVLTCAASVLFVPLAEFGRLLRDHRGRRPVGHAGPAADAVSTSIVDGRLLRRLLVAYVVMAAPLLTLAPGVDQLLRGA